MTCATWWVLASFTLCGCVQQGSVYIADDAKMLPEAERAVMLQPERGFLGPRDVRLSGSEEKAFNERFSPFSVPSSIEVAAGKHEFLYDGGNSWTTCWFVLDMQAGHTYKPKGVPYPQIRNSIANCNNSYCLLDLIETGPNGDIVNYPIFCGGPYEMKLMNP